MVGRAEGRAALQTRMYFRPLSQLYIGIQRCSSYYCQPGPDRTFYNLTTQKMSTGISRLDVTLRSLDFAARKLRIPYKPFHYFIALKYVKRVYWTLRKIPRSLDLEACSSCNCQPGPDRTFYNLKTQKKSTGISSRILWLVNCEYPTDPLTILALWNPSHNAPELHGIRRSTDFEAPNPTSPFLFRVLKSVARQLRTKEKFVDPRILRI